MKITVDIFLWLILFDLGYWFSIAPEQLVQMCVHRRGTANSRKHWLTYQVEFYTVYLTWFKIRHLHWIIPLNIYMKIDIWTVCETLCTSTRRILRFPCCEETREYIWVSASTIRYYKVCAIDNPINDDTKTHWLHVLLTLFTFLFWRHNRLWIAYKDSAIITPAPERFYLTCQISILLVVILKGVHVRKAS